MPELSPETVLRICRDVRYRRVLDEAVVVRQQAAEALVLNEVAAELLERCDGLNSLAAVIAALGAEYEVDAETLRKDVFRFAGELIATGVLEVGHAP